MAGPADVRPAATAPPLTPTDQLSQAWTLVQNLPDREREELHRRLTATLPVVFTAEPVSLACSEAACLEQLAGPSNQNQVPDAAVNCTPPQVGNTQRSDAASSASDSSLRPRPANPAAWWRRLAATVVDTALVNQIVSLFLVNGTMRAVLRRAGVRRRSYAFNLAVYGLYHAGSHWIWPGQSIGKRVFRLKVVRSSEDHSSNG